jgi:hypothetical protein
MTKPKTKSAPLKAKKEKAPVKHGRPSKYEPHYGSMLIDHMSQGLSFETFAAIIQVDRDTLYEWRKVHPAFSDAFKRGRDLSQLTWERMGLEGITGKIQGFNVAGYIFNMKVRFQQYGVPMADEKAVSESQKALDEALEEIRQSKTK